MAYQTTNYSTMIGKAGELAVAAELLARGVQVHFPATDDGVDLLAGGRIRIQVKTAHRRPRFKGGYAFSIGNKRIGKNKQASKYLRHYVGVVDFLVCYGIDDKKAWVIPVSVFAKYGQVMCLSLGTEHKSVVDGRRLRALLGAGHSQVEVAQIMSIHPVTVSEHARGRNSAGRNPAAIQVSVVADKYLNAWHEIEAAVKLANEIDDIDPLSVLSSSEIEHIEAHFEERFKDHAATAAQEK